MKIYFRRRISFCFLFLLSLAAPLLAQPPRYEIDAQIDPARKTLAAHQSTTWTNNGNTEVDDLVFHIYPNRFYTNAEKDFLRRFAAYFNVLPFSEGFQTGRMRIDSVSMPGRNLKFFVEGDDRTLLKIELPQPVKPGESVTVSLAYFVEIPHLALGRFGWNEGVFRLSRWYPILSVYDPQKGWDRTPFYPFHRPFYSEASNYFVRLTVPENQVIISTGSLSGEHINPDGTKTQGFDAPQPVREFSFAMSEYYQSIRKEVNGTGINSYYLPGSERSAREALQSAADLMAFYSGMFGKYPYYEYSIAPVDLGYGGEQMSNLIFIDRRVYEMPDMMRRYLDFLVAHETGHQWFYNMIGADEYTEMWLEEGLNSYFIEQYLDNKYGPGGGVIDFPRWTQPYVRVLPKLTFRATRDTRYKSVARIGMDHAVIGDLSSFSEPSAIFSVTYGKGARVLGMLKSMVGEEVFDRVFKRIFAEFQFKNLNVREFMAICEQESGKDLKDFFDQWLFGKEQFNYAVAGVEKSAVILRNKAGIKMPAEVSVIHKNGIEENFVWQGLTKMEIVSLKDPSPVREVRLDPQLKWLDIDRTDNVWPRKVHFKFVPLYLGLYEIPAFIPDDGYSLIAGPELANNGLGLKVSWQKPYDQIFYGASDYEPGERLLHSRAGYELKNVLNTQTVLGFEFSNTTDYDDGSEDLVSGKIFARRELWPAAYHIADINDHATVYLVRNQSINDGADLLSGREGVRNADYGRRREAIAGTALHFERDGTSPDPQEGYKIDIFAENAGHFLEATQAFSRGAVDASVYVPVTNKTTAAGRLKYGGGFPDDKNLFTAGGMDGLRGYDRKTIRGSSMLLGSLEYRFPVLDHLKLSAFDHILGLERIGGVVFADAGESWYSALDSAPLRKDAGFGLRFTVNIGSVFQKVLVRMDVAQAINDSAEDHPRFWMGINHAF